MSDKADLIFGVDTSQAVTSLQRLDKALKDTLYQMGKGSVAPFSQLTKGSKDASDAAKKAAQDLEALAKSSNKAAEQMVTYSQRVGNASYRVKVGLNETYTEAAKKMEDFNKALKDPSSFLNHQKRMMEDLKATQVWSKKRKDSLIEIVNAEDSSRKKLLSSLRKDIEDRSKLQVAAHQFEASQLQKHLQTLTQASSSSRQKELAEMRRTIKEREQATRDHAREMMRIESNIAAQRRRQESLSMGYLESSLQSRLRTLQKIQALQESGSFSTPTIARRHGVEALGDLRNIENIQKQVALQREMEKIERQALSTKAQGAPVVGKNTAAILKNNKAMHDARGLARGLSGALGQLWLTYGSLGPLVAGAAMGAIARQTYEIGKDVEYRLAMVEALGNRAIKISEMMPAVHGSMKTPLEAAQGLQELAQAGLNAEQSLMALSTVLNLATLGEMSVGDAALTTTAALSTFNLEVGEAIRVGNVYAKTASISNTNVQGIAEAMKQAGSAAAIYGVEIEAVAGQIAILAQNGIRGSAAGTAVRNAMTELHAPTQKAQGIMKELGIEIYNSDKTSRDYIEVLGDLRNTYYSLNEESRAAMLRGMFNERSRRLIQIAIKDYDQLKEVIDRVKDSQGFLMEANLKLLDTVEGASNRMQSVLQQSLVEAFDLSKPQIMTAIQNMEQLFASDEFKRGVTTLARAVADLTSFMSEHASTILKVGAAYVGWKLAIRPMIPAMVALARPLKNITEYATKFGQVMGVLPLTISKTTPVVTTTAAATTTLWSRIVLTTGAVVRFLGPMGLVAGTLLTASTMMNRYRTATEGAAPAQDTLQDRVARATKALNMQNTELRENLKLRKLTAEGSTPEIHDTNLLIGESEVKMGQIVSDIAFRNKQVATLEKVLEDHRTGVKSLSDAALTTIEQSVASNRRELGVLTKQLEVIAKDYAGLKGSLTESAEVNLLNYNFDVLEGMKRTLQEATLMANSMPENMKVQNAAEGIRYLTEEFERSGGSADDFKASVDELYKTIQQNLGSWTPKDDKSDTAARRMERDLERYDVWLRKQLEAIKTSDLLTKAYLGGEEQVRQYTLAQEIANVQIADRTKHEKQIAEVLKQKNLAETRMNVAKQVADLGKQTKTAEGYAKVLLAQSKGYAQGEAALKKFNKEQAINNLLTEIAPENMEELIEVLERFRKVYDEAGQQDERNENLRELNGLVEQTKNSTQLYREQLERLQKLKPVAGTPEQIRAYNLAIRNLHIENNAFLSALNQGFTDLEKTAGGMWQQFFEEGRITMESTSKLFKRMLADMAHAAITKPIIISLQNMVMGTNVAGGWGEVYGGGAAGGSSLGGVMGSLGGVGSLFTNFGQTMGTSIYNLGGTLTGFSDATAGLGEMLMGSADTIGSALDFAGTAFSYGSSILNLTKGNYGAAAGGAIGTYFGGPVGSFLGSTLGGMVDGLFGGGEKRTGSRWTYSKDSGRAEFYEGTNSGKAGAKAIQDTMTQVMGSAVSAIDDLFRMVGANAEVAAYKAMFESSGKGRGGTFSGGTLLIEDQEVSFGTNVKGTGYGGKSGSAEEMFENMTKDMSFSTLEAWKTVSGQLPKTLQQMLDVSIRELSVEGATQLASDILSIVQGVTALSEVLNELPMENLKNLGFDVTYELNKNFESTEQHLGYLSNYYQNFYSEAEKVERAIEQMTGEFESIGYTLPESRQEFRNLFETLEITGDESYLTYQKLLELSGGIAELYGPTDNLSGLIGSLASSINYMEEITSTGMNAVQHLAEDLYETLWNLDSDWKYTENLSQYVNSLYSEQDRLAIQYMKLERTLMSLGQDVPQTNEDYIKLVETLDLTTEAGRQLHYELVKLAPEFSSVMNSMSQSLVKAEQDVMRVSNERVNEATSQVDRLFSKVREIAQDEIQKLEKLKTNTDNVFSLLESKSNERIKNLRDITSFVDSTLKNIRGNQTPTQMMGFQKSLDNVRSASKQKGDIDYGLLKESVDNIQKVYGGKDYLTSADRMRDQLVLANQLEKIQENVEPQLDSAVEQLKVLKRQYDTLRGVDTSLELQLDQIVGLNALSRQIEFLAQEFQTKAVAESIANQQIEKINKQLELYQEQIDTLRGVNIGIKGLNGDLNKGFTLLASAIKSEAAARAAQKELEKAQSSPKPAVGSNAWADSYYANNPDVFDAYKENHVAWNIGYTEMAKHHWDNYGKYEGRKYATGGLHPGGIRMVGEFGPELEVTGPSRIHNARKTEEILGRFSGTNQDQTNVQLMKELEYIRAENDKLVRVLIDLQHRQIRLLERWESDGLPETREWITK